MTIKKLSPKQRITLFSFLFPISIIPFLISYLADTSKTIWIFNLIYGEPFSWFSLIELLVTLFVSYLLLEFFLWLFYDLQLYINLKWVAWALLLNNILWISLPISLLFANIGLPFVEYVPLLLYAQHLFIGPFIIYFTSLLIYIFFKVLKMDVYALIPIFPKDLDPLDAIISIFSVYIIRTLIGYFI